jgi:hypothetical protein
MQKLERALALAAVPVVWFALNATEAAAQQTFPKGEGTLLGRGKLAVKGCDKASGRSGTLYTVDATGTFVENPSNPIVGTLIPQGSSARVFAVSYDAANQAIIRAIMENAGSQFCASPYTLSSLQVAASFKLSKRGTRATVRQRASFSGSTATGQHPGAFKAKDSGAWFTTP